MLLQEKLDQMKADFETKAPAEALEVMHRATEDLKNSGILDSCLKKGDASPKFTLADPTGAEISSSVLLEKGPLVVSFYRGGW